ncbi:PREDICTED: uncharacterized protein LOC105359773 [Ceratosolen solmsi marchali]|uniref:Uncharacterized protein LOC105359773 n=1 Tax=Ceratosolen solmsi marchali TaxID=326594 RepID=A0AAJ6VLQ5_9HYME|nr:PREDICTED: uncharacterized protein LOC105359773 [Ceratosolen solmsi marchali]
MAHYWLVLINICLLLVIINIPFNSAQSYEVSRKTVYSNSGTRGTVICNYFPENEILPTSTSILGSLYPLRRFIRRNTRKSFFRTRKGLRGF